MLLMEGSAQEQPAPVRLPRLGFLGVGWIGRARMEALARSGAAEIAMLCDPSPDNLASAQASAPSALLTTSFDAMLDQDIDGVVIATPSAMHAEQSVRALARGKAVFCQKPLGRDAREASRAVDAARRADRLLGVDLSYRFTQGARAIKALLAEGALGQVQAVDLVFHNAYGPDKPWFYDPAQSGGGCLVDLGIHLVDLALWALDFPEVVDARGHLFAKGRRFADRAAEVEDLAFATLVLANGAVVRLACSWHLHAGQEAVISADFHGVEGGASLRNVAGSFYDFAAWSHRGTSRTALAEPPDDWGGGAVTDWARRLARSPGFDPASERFVEAALVLDRIYDSAERR